MEIKRGDFVKVSKGAKTSLILPHHNTILAEKWGKKDLEIYDYTGLVCKVNDFDKKNIVICLSFGAEIHWYSINDIELL